MTTQLSPGVKVTEIDLTTIVPAVATSEGAIGGVFRWGPIGERVLVDNEQKLVTRFGKPTAINPETFFAAASFLAYGNRLYVSRAANTTGSSYANGSPNITNATMSAVGITDDNAALRDQNLIFDYNVKNEKDFIAKEASNVFLDNDIHWIAKYPGEMGNSLKVSMCDSADAWNKVYSMAPTSVTLANNLVVNSGINASASYLTADIGSYKMLATVTPNDYTSANFVAAATKVIADLANNLTTGDLIEVGNNAVNKQLVRIVSTDAYSNAYYSASITANAATLVGSTLINLNAGTTGIPAGATISGAGIPAGTIITRIANSTFIEISNPTTTSLGAFYTVVAPAKFSFTINNKIRIKTNVQETSVNRYWEYFGSFDRAPGQTDWLAARAAQDPDSANGAAMDEVHVVVVDNKGLFTGVPGSILERYQGLSRVTEAKDDQGATLYFKDALNFGSQFVWFVQDEDTAPSANAIAITSSTSIEPSTYYLVGGKDGLEEDFVEEAVLYDAYDQFINSNESDISLVLQGKARGGDRGQQLGNYIIDNICEHRKDCVAFLSPNFESVINNLYQEVDDVIAFRNAITSSSYAVIDSGYKYMYDRYNDVYRWVPLNGDIAGLCARTDDTNDPWWSPAGYNRGIIKNVVKLAYNPSQAERDSLYKNDVNPVINVTGAGTLLYGDKTALGKPSAFDRINVRRLFIVLEKAISLAAKYTLFEFNDAFTRTQFRNLIEPYLRDVQGRRGIYDFKVVCDETNNTPEVIDSNRFIGDIYIKPARSINFIQLNFIAVRTGVAFNEIIGLRQ